MTTIRDLLQQLHQTHDLGVLPVLADALLDAGYPESEAAWVRKCEVRSGLTGSWAGGYFVIVNGNALRSSQDDPMVFGQPGARRKLARLIHERLTVLCGVCEGRTPQFCSGPCGGVGWLVKPPFQSRKCPECDGDGWHCSPLMTRVKCSHCKGTGTVEETKL